MRQQSRRDASARVPTQPPVKPLGELAIDTHQSFIRNYGRKLGREGMKAFEDALHAHAVWYLSVAWNLITQKMGPMGRDPKSAVPRKRKSSK